MNGNNKLILCLGEMVVAVQLYIDQLMPNASVQVKEVSEKDNKIFVIELAGKDVTIE